MLLLMSYMHARASVLTICESLGKRAATSGVAYRVEMNMRRLRLSLGVLGAWVAGAMLSTTGAQADGVARGSLKDAPIVAPICRWGGAYVGVDTGVATTNTQWRFPQDEVDTLGGGQRIARDYFDYRGGEDFNSRQRAWTYSGHVGINIPTSTPVVLGLELGYTGGNLDKTQTNPFDPRDSFTTRISHIVEVKGRLGYTWGCTMAYTKFGYATGRVETSGAGISTTGNIPVTALSDSSWHNGYTVGGGLEYMLTPNIVLGIEYDWVDLNKRRQTTPVLLNTTRQQASNLVREINPDAHLFVARLSYKFGQ